jgi:hypothetical protein
VDPSSVASLLTAIADKQAEDRADERVDRPGTIAVLRSAAEATHANRIAVAIGGVE